MIYYMDIDTEASWLLLVISLPTSSATGRMRIWRALKSLGCVALRDGAYLLPCGPGRAEALRELGDECVARRRQRLADDGDAGLARRRHRLSAALRPLGAVRRAALELEEREPRPAVPVDDRARRASSDACEKEFDALRAIDFFPSEASVEAEAAWVDFSKRIDALLSPDEPHETAGRVPRLDAGEVPGPNLGDPASRLWVDRVASAWLIRRFIDPEARFRWLAKPSDCPKSALGFDFDGATFTHVGDRVTFETLLASFGLDGDAALARLGTIVHALDVGGDPVPEAKGFEAVMAGARERLDGRRRPARRDEQRCSIPCTRISQREAQRVNEKATT